MPLTRSEVARGKTGRSLYSAWNAGSFVDGNLHVQMSNDGASFNNRSTGNGDSGSFSGYTPHDSTMFGCPALSPPIGGKVYAAGSVGVTTTDWTANHFEIASTSDGNSFSYVATVDFSSFFGSTTHPQCWPTSFFIDGSGVAHIIFEYSTDSLQSGDALIYHLYETHDTSGGSLTSWSTPVQITGTGATGYIGLQSGNSQLDGQIIQQGSTFNLFFKNDHSGKKCIEVSQSSSLTGPYTTSFQIDDWAGWSFGNGTHMEAPHLMQIGSEWRIYLDQEGSGIYCSKSANGLFGTWSTPVLITYSSGDFSPSGHAQHGGCIINPFG